jgi:hypothetical protein
VAGTVLPHDVVWLVPRTLGAPAICWQQPCGVVVGIDWPYVVVAIDGENHRVHNKNVTRTDPNLKLPQAKNAARPHKLTGCEELPLW